VGLQAMDAPVLMVVCWRFPWWMGWQHCNRRDW